mmetsp:Transcript_48342/g.121772  ORF Transcript_48342/g.121772 Transcript_48342/m.121772 type:complete len:120 (+) Transcript_48342:104-463(+)
MPVDVVKKSTKKGTTLLERKEAAKKPRGPLTVQERRERNLRLAKKLQEERLRASFGRARDADTKKKQWWEDLRDECEEGKEIAPTRKKVSRAEDNLAKLTKKQDQQSASLMARALQYRL